MFQENTFWPRSGLSCPPRNQGAFSRDFEMNVYEKPDLQEGIRTKKRPRDKIFSPSSPILPTFQEGQKNTFWRRSGLSSLQRNQGKAFSLDSEMNVYEKPDLQETIRTKKRPTEKVFSPSFPIFPMFQEGQENDFWPRSDRSRRPRNQKKRFSLDSEMNVNKKPDLQETIRTKKRPPEKVFSPSFPIFPMFQEDQENAFWPRSGLSSLSGNQEKTFSLDSEVNMNKRPDLQETIRTKKRAPRFRDGDIDEGHQKKKKQRRNEPTLNQGPTLDLPVKFRKRIRALGGSNISLVIQKPLFKTDLSTGHNRLSIPLNQIQQGFLTPEESELLNSGRNEKQCADMKVMLIEPSLHRGTISLRKWDMKKSSGNSTSVYVLVSNWNSVVWRNALRVNETVQLWSFRIKSELGFALVKRRGRQLLFV